MLTLTLEPHKHLEPNLEPEPCVFYWHPRSKFYKLWLCERKNDIAIFI